MYTLLIVLLFILGLFFIVRGGDFLVEACLKISDITGINKIIIGATLVSLATALPEICVSLIAIANDLHHLAVGNALGSMICNVALVLGAAFIISQKKINLKNFETKAWLLLSLNIVLFIFALNLKIGMLESFVLLVSFVLFFIYNFVKAKKQVKENKTPKIKDKKLILKTIIKFAVGTFGIFVGAKMLVSNGELLALALGVNSEAIGLTIIAFGTCLPELITTIISIKKESMELALGNIVGANIINITLLFGLGSVLSGFNLSLPLTSLLKTLPILLLSVFLLILPILNTSKTHKFQGILLVAIYVIYMLYIIASLALGI